MMRSIKNITSRYWVLLFLILYGNVTFSQVTINIPEQATDGYTLQELSLSSYTNSSGQRYNACYSIITGNNLTNGQNFAIRTAPFNISLGTSMPGYGVIQGGTIMSPSADYYELEQSGKFPPGIYTLCINLYDSRGSILGKQCIPLNISNDGNILLISPTNEEVLNTFNPTFNWLPLKSPNDNKYSYNIHICELLPGQSYSDAMSFNLPLVYQINVSGNSYSYPSAAPQLEDDKQYVWQIEAEIKNHSKTYSEIWMFQYKKPGQQPPVKHKSTVLYPQTTLKLSAAYYEFNDTISFKYINYNNDSILNYSFKQTGKADTMKLESKAEVKLKPLVNYLRIPVATEMKNQKKKQVYKLEIHNSRNEIWALQFIITKKKR